MIIYTYTFKIKDKKVLNNIKRRFYYNFNAKVRKKSTKISKNLFFIDSNNDLEVEDFFKEFSGFLEVHKIRAESIEKILEVTPP